MYYGFPLTQNCFWCLTSKPSSCHTSKISLDNIVSVLGWRKVDICCQVYILSTIFLVNNRPSLWKPSISYGGHIQESCSPLNPIPVSSISRMSFSYNHCHRTRNDLDVANSCIARYHSWRIKKKCFLKRICNVPCLSWKERWVCLFFLQYHLFRNHNQSEVLDSRWSSALPVDRLAASQSWQPSWLPDPPRWPCRLARWEGWSCCWSTACPSASPTPTHSALEKRDRCQRSARFSHCI